jgi:CHAD domain-containing protein
MSCEAHLGADGDPDAVHDFRVAQRRTRVLLREYGDVLPPGPDSLRKDLQWLARRTGPVRDLDMLLQGVRRRALDAGARLRPGLAALALVLAEERRLATARLGRRLAAPRYGQLIRTWRSLAGRAGNGPGATARAAFAAATRNRLRDRYALLVAAVRRLPEDAPDAAIHRARIAAKSVRYLLEFLDAVEPSGDVTLAIGGLKAVQDRLGSFQDDVVHAAMLEDRLSAGELPAAVLRAARHEAVRIARRRDRSRRPVVRALGRVAGPRFRSRLGRVTGPDEG